MNHASNARARRSAMRAALLSILLLAAAFDARAIDPMPFADAAEEARFRALAAELRCVMCQNQSLADSDAMIAQDLRREVFDLMRQGRSDEEIKTFLTERYTEFVLYRPRVEPRTWLIWFGPAVLLIAGAITLIVIVRKRGGQKPPDGPPPSEDDW